MRKFSSEIISAIRSPDFYYRAYKELSQIQPGPAMWHRLDETLKYSIAHYAHRVEREMAYSDPLPGATIDSQVKFYLGQFLQEFSNAIVTDEIPIYSISDSLATSRTDPRLSPEATLKSWMDNPATSSVYRDDPMCGAGNRGGGSEENGRPRHSPNAPTVYGGITFCDQSQLGQSVHEDLYKNTAYKRALNCEQTTRFGVATPESDARLLSRRVFRANEDGVENGIPKYHSRINRRMIDRDVSETMRGGGEMEGFGGRYDMGSISRRIDHKNAVASMSGGKYSDRRY